MQDNGNSTKEGREILGNYHCQGGLYGEQLKVAAVRAEESAAQLMRVTDNSRSPRCKKKLVN